jgi:hypothetical protein
MAKKPAATPEPVAETPPREIKKTKCSITRKFFEDHAKDLVVSINGRDTIATVHRQKDGTIGFSTGSLGWHNSEKIVMDLGNQPIKVQCNLSFMVIGSKELPK